MPNSGPISKSRKNKAGLRMDLVERLGIRLDRDKALALSKNGVLTAELLAEVALADPANCDNKALLPYRPGGSQSDNPYVNFYWDYCSPGKPAFVHIAIMSLADAVLLVRDSGGVPTIAHPGKTLKNHEDALAGILARGVAGIEAYSSYHTPEECRYWRRCADEAQVLFTCGSDFHGKTKPAIRLGCHGGGVCGCEVWENLKTLAGVERFI